MVGDLTTPCLGKILGQGEGSGRASEDVLDTGWRQPPVDKVIISIYALFVRPYLEYSVEEPMIQETD